MKTYEERKAEVLRTARSNKHYCYFDNWRYNKRCQYAESLTTGEVFKWTLDEFLIEKGFIDYMNCDDELSTVHLQM